MEVQPCFSYTDHRIKNRRNLKYEEKNSTAVRGTNGNNCSPGHGRMRQQRDRGAGEKRGADNF